MAEGAIINEKNGLKKIVMKEIGMACLTAFVTVTKIRMLTLPG